MTKPHIQRIQPYLLCQPTLTYSKKGICFNVNSTADIQTDAILWSATSTESDVNYNDANGDEYTNSTRMNFSDDDDTFVK